MKQLLLVALLIPFFAMAQGSRVQLYTNDFKDVVENNQTLVCDDLTSLGVRLNKDEKMMKYDLIEVSVSFKYKETGSLVRSGKDRWIGYKNYALHKEYYPKKYGDEKVHDLYLIKSDPDQIGEEFEENLGYHTDINTFKDALCLDAEKYNDFKVELKGYYTTGDKYVSDGNGDVYLKYSYDDGEVLGVTKFKMEQGKETQQKVLLEKNKKKVESIKNNLESRVFDSIDNDYVEYITLYGAKIKKIKKKNLYNAFLLLKEDMLKGIKNTENLEEEHKKWERLEAISLKIRTLVDENTKSLEKLLRDVKDVDKILELIES
jgi:hypothetical protein